MRDRTRLAVVVVLLFALVLVVVFSLRGSNQKPPAPTIDIGAVQTKAVMTFARDLTGTALALPTSTATSTPEPTSATTTQSVSATPSCYRLKFVRDLTIPDNTPMSPADVFTKTWEVQNTGLCAWRVGFKLVLIGGEAMGGSPYVLTATANSGAKLPLSIKMVAPTSETGIVQGTWRMSDDTGALFGDALTVVIVVGNGTNVPPTSGATATP